MEVLDAVWQSIEGGRITGQHLRLILIDRGYVETMWASTQIIPSKAREEQVQLGRGLKLLHLHRTST